MTRLEWERVTLGWKIERRESLRYASPPTEEQLDAFEMEFQFKLPASYRAFVSITGAGMLADYFRIKTPDCEDKAFDLSLSNRRKREALPDDMRTWPDLYGAEDVARLQRMVWFSSNYLGDEYGWDMIEGSQGEYEIILSWRTEYRLEKVAASFDEFIMDFCLGPKYFDIYTKGTKSPKTRKSPFSKPRETFAPASVGMAKPPSRKT